jgi:hypothetical protein
VLDRYGNQRSDAAARMGKSRAVNMLVESILGDYFSDQNSPKQLVVALCTASKHHKVRMLLKSAGLADVDELDALRFQNEQIHRILKTTNDSKKKSNGTDDVRSYEQSVYSAMAESPVSSNCIGKVPTITSRARLFPDIPKTTFVRGMGIGKVHRKKTVSFSRVLKRLGNKKVSCQLEEAFLKWLDNHSIVIQNPLATDTLLVSDPENPGNKKRMNKILLQIPVRELHNDLVNTDPLMARSR